MRRVGITPLIEYRGAPKNVRFGVTDAAAATVAIAGSSSRVLLQSSTVTLRKAQSSFGVVFVQRRTVT